VIGHATLNESSFKNTSTENSVQCTENSVQCTENSVQCTDPLRFYHLGSLEDVQVQTLLSLYTNTKQCPARVTDTRSANKHDFLKKVGQGP